MIKVKIPKWLLSKNNNRTIKSDLKKTWNLNTAIIENEWIINLNKDIFEGPKYLIPLIEFISTRLLKFFFTVPE